MGTRPSFVSFHPSKGVDMGGVSEVILATPWRGVDEHNHAVPTTLGGGRCIEIYGVFEP